MNIEQYQTFIPDFPEVKGPDFRETSLAGAHDTNHAKTQIKQQLSDYKKLLFKAGVTPSDIMKNYTKMLDDKCEKKDNDKVEKKPEHWAATLDVLALATKEINAKRHAGKETLGEYLKKINGNGHFETVLYPGNEVYLNLDEKWSSTQID